MSTPQVPLIARSREIEYRKPASWGEFIDAIRVRVDTFIIEQECPPGWEPDADDKTSEHYIAVDQGVVVATARLREAPPGALKIERMAVRKDSRGQGIGTSLTRHMVHDALRRRPAKLWMEAQSHARSFYEHSGFRATSDEYDMFGLGIPHVVMEYAGGPDDPAGGGGT